MPRCRPRSSCRHLADRRAAAVGQAVDLGARQPSEGDTATSGAVAVGRLGHAGMSSTPGALAGQRTEQNDLRRSSWAPQWPQSNVIAVTVAPARDDLAKSSRANERAVAAADHDRGWITTAGTQRSAN